MQKNAFFNNKLANKTLKVFTKSKTKLKSISMPKGKEKHKQLEILEFDKIIRCLSKTIEKLINLFGKKSINYFNLKKKNASLQAKIMQNKEKFDWLKAEIKKINARMQETKEAISTQYNKIKEKIERLNQKLRKICDLQNRLSKA